MGNEYEYKGSHQADGIVSYMRKQAGPPSKLLHTAAELESFKGQDKLVLVAFCDASHPDLASYRCARLFRTLERKEMLWENKGYLLLFFGSVH